MKSFIGVLRIGALAFFAVGALHLVLGVGADVLLGANLPREAIEDPALDSQNRFYGVSFTLYGVLLLLCASDVHKYKTVLRCLLWVFLAAGLARLISIAIYGMPPLLVQGLLVSEVLIPPFFLYWLSAVERESGHHD